MATADVPPQADASPRAALDVLPKELRRGVVSLALELPPSVHQHFTQLLLAHWPISEPEDRVTPTEGVGKDAHEAFQQELTYLINGYCIENGSNTPDFILAEFLVLSLEAFNRAVNARQRWYGDPNRGPERR